MKLSIRVAIMFLLATLSSTQFASAFNKTGLTRDEIKALPITDRPQRPGHIYGRTVRRMHGVVGWQLLGITEGVERGPESVPTPSSMSAR